MSRRSLRPSISTRRASSLVALALASFVGGGCTRSREASAPGASPPAGRASSGFRVYRDPATGAFVEPPPAPGAALPKAAQTAGPSGLTEVAAPGGGTMIQLGGAFRSDVTARRGAAGAEVSCATTAAPGR